MNEVLNGLRTYLMGAGIIIHQALKYNGIDVGDSLISESIDALLGIGAIYFRWKAAIESKKKIEIALMTEPPKTEVK